MLAGNARGKPKGPAACQEAQAKAREEEEWLRDAVEQLDKLAAETDEEDRLAEERTRHAHAARIAEALQHAHAALANEDGGDICRWARAIAAGAPERGCWRFAGRGHRRFGTRYCRIK